MEHVVDLIYGHGGISKAIYRNVSAACGFPCDAMNWTHNECVSTKSPSQQCSDALVPVARQLQQLLNIYNYYDTCGYDNMATVRERLHRDAGVASLSLPQT